MPAFIIYYLQIMWNSY